MDQSTTPGWRKLDLSQLENRLIEVKQLLEQAVALAEAADGERVAAVARQGAKQAEAERADPQRRRYR
jgi:hypothetical protein